MFNEGLSEEKAMCILVSRILGKEVDGSSPLRKPPNLIRSGAVYGLSYLVVQVRFNSVEMGEISVATEAIQ